MAAQRRDRELGIGGDVARVRDEEFDFLGLQVLQQVAPVVAADGQLQTGTLGAHAGEQGGQEGGGRQRAAAESDLADVAVAQQAHVALQTARLVDQAPRLLHELHSDGGQRHVAVVAVEQGQAQFLFQGLDAAAERGLAQVYLFCRARKAQFVGQGDGVAQAFDVRNLNDAEIRL